MNYYHSDDGRLTQRAVIDTFREYWERHTLWVRAYIVNLINNSPNTVYIYQRIVENASEFAKLYCGFYDEECDIRDLLISRFVPTQRFLYNIFTGDEAAARQEAEEWIRYAGAFAERIAELNPYLDITELRRLQTEYLDAIEAEMRDRMTQRGYGDDYPETELAAREIADYLAQSIIYQFAIDE